jgi:2-polyprenyl-3-methyl-5-hydroxy-6-metoxy-1,4-benzoquinol methylase
MNQRDLYNKIYTLNGNYNHNLDYKLVHVLKFVEGIKGKILDAGCGEGYYLRGLLKEGYDVYGVELSEVCCKMHLEKIPHECSSIIEHALKNIKYEAVICSDVLEHISYEEVEANILALASMASKALIGVANHSEIQQGHELHIIQENELYWEDLLSKYYKNVYLIRLSDRFYFFNCENI